jgi:hypothetical protein
MYNCIITLNHLLIMTDKSSRGVVYLAIGTRHVSEASVSALSVHRHFRIPCTIFTDLPEEAKKFQCFDQVIAIQPSGRRAHRDKLFAMCASPYIQTLFLDTDTFIGDNLDDCWQLLDYFDLAFAGDRGYVDNFPQDSGVPDSFKEPNMGVVFYRLSEELISVFDESLKLYDKFAKADSKFFNDQVPFRIALYSSKLRFYVLTDEYNCRFANYGKLNGKLRVLHGRLESGKFDFWTLSRILDRLNTTTVPRVFAAGTVIALWPRRIKWIKKYRPKYLPKIDLIDFNLVAKRLFRKLVNALTRRAKKYFN